MNHGQNESEVKDEAYWRQRLEEESRSLGIGSNGLQKVAMQAIAFALLDISNALKQIAANTAPPLPDAWTCTDPDVIAKQIAQARLEYDLLFKYIVQTPDSAT